MAPVSRLGFLEKISREHGVASVIDTRVTSKAEIRGKLEQFFELLEDR